MKDMGELNRYHNNHTKHIKMQTSWWRHQMETFSALLAPLWGESTDYRWILLTKASGAEL